MDRISLSFKEGKRCNMFQHISSFWRFPTETLKVSDDHNWTHIWDQHKNNQAGFFLPVIFV